MTNTSNNFCNFCNFCNSCDSCDFSKNLKMSEYQLFCYAEKYGSDNPDSYQQKPYRIFNSQITELEYRKIKIPKIKLEFDKNVNYSTRYQTAFKNAWELLSQKEREEFLNLPHFDLIIFYKITGVDVKVKTITKQEAEEQLGCKIVD
jgi:hypothetical protein